MMPEMNTTTEKTATIITSFSRSVIETSREQITQQQKQQPAACRYQGETEGQLSCARGKKRTDQDALAHITKRLDQKITLATVQIVLPI